MNSAIRDLLPDEVDISTTALPSEVLEFQAERLEQRTHGFLKARILRTTSESEVVLSFEVMAPTLDFTAILFKVRHRPNLEYPALIVPPEPLPKFLQPTVTVKKVKKGMLGTGAAIWAAQRPFDEVEETTEKNNWLAVTAEEFEDKIGEVLKSPQIRSIFQNLGSQAKRVSVSSSPGNEPTDVEQ
jgi:hypothetical protein